MFVNFSKQASTSLSTHTSISLPSLRKMVPRLIPIAAALLILLTASQLHGADAQARCYDHQTTDYSSQFKPTECGQQCSVTPFFSPDHSLDVYLDLIASAQESIDIFTPG